MHQISHQKTLHKIGLTQVMTLSIKTSNANAAGGEFSGDTYAAHQALVRSNQQDSQQDSQQDNQQGNQQSKLSKGALKQAIFDECREISSKNDSHHQKAEALLQDLRALYPADEEPSSKTDYGKALTEIAQALANITGNANSPNGAANDIRLAPIQAAMIDNKMDLTRELTKATTYNPLGGLDFTSGNTDASGLTQDDSAADQAGKITAGFRAQEVRLPSNIVNSMKLFEDQGLGVGDRLKSLEKVAKDLNEGPKTLNALSAGEKLQFAAKANVLLF